MFSQPINVRKNVKVFPQDAKYKSIDFLAECAKHIDYPIEQLDVTIQAPAHTLPKIDPKQLIIPKLSFGELSADEIANILNQIIPIVFDPLKVSKYLKNLDDNLGNVMEKNGISFAGNDPLPKYLLAGRGNFIPGPSSASYHPQKKAELLDKLLLKRENLRGVNLSQGTVKFIGYVTSEYANQMVANGQLFSEHKQINRVLLHGSYTHRLLLEALAQAAKEGNIDLKIKSSQTLNFVQLLEILVHVSVDGNNLWGMLLDSTEDMQATATDPLDPKQFNFSCRSPFVLNSLLLCFGKELGLPHLQLYLLDSHYKAAYQMVLRTKENIAAKEGILYSEINIPNETIYEHCMEYFSTMATNYGDLGGVTSFTLDKMDLLPDPRYSASGYTIDIRRKKPQVKQVGQYSDGWPQYFEKKENRKPGFFSNEEEKMKDYIFQKYKIDNSDAGNGISPKSKLERALIAAVQAGEVSDVKWLLKIGTNPNVTDGLEHTPLHLAIKAANKSKDADDTKALQYQKCVELLLDKRADLTAQDYQFLTPMEYDKNNLFKQKFILNELSLEEKKTFLEKVDESKDKEDNEPKPKKLKRNP